MTAESTARTRRRRRPWGRPWGRRGVVVAALVGALSVAGGVVAWQQVADQPADPVVTDDVDAFTGGEITADGVPTRDTAADDGVAAADDDVVLAAGEQVGVASRSVDDPLGDTDFPFTDVDEASVRATADGQVTATLVVDEWTDPGSDDWRYGATGPTWYFDVDGDAKVDGQGVIRVRDGQLTGALIGSAGVVRCLGDVSTSATASSYSLTFDVRCISNPERFRFRSGFDYEDVVFDLTDADLGPDSGWSAEIVNPAFVSPLVTVEPERAFDSRKGPGRRTAGSTTEIEVVGVAGVPDDARAVVVNVTAINPDGRGYATVFPCGFPQPETSNLNYEAGENIPNAVLAKVGPEGTVCVFVSTDVHLAVDVNGYVPRVSDVGELPPGRVYDSRRTGGRRAAGSITEVELTDLFGVPEDAAGVVLNVTAVNPSAPGFVTVFPCGEDLPLASNLAYRPGANSASAAVALVGASGKVCFYTIEEIDLLVDVNGFLPAGTRVEPVTPARLVDTRKEGERPGTGTVTVLDVAGRAGVPADASGVILNVTAVQPDAVGYVTVYPCVDEIPLASNVNYRPGVNSPNAVVADLDDDGDVCLYTSAPVDLVVDVNAFIP